jgi:hypothetical protein
VKIQNSEKGIIDDKLDITAKEFIKI